VQEIPEKKFGSNKLYTVLCVGFFRSDLIKEMLKKLSQVISENRIPIVPK